MGQKYVYNPLTCEYDIINEGAPGVPGPRGPVGSSGPAGPPGQDGEGVVPGGTTGQVLSKASDDDYDTEWVDQSGGGGGGSTLQDVLDSGSEYYGMGTLSMDNVNDSTESRLSAGTLRVTSTESYSAAVFASQNGAGVEVMEEGGGGMATLRMDDTLGTGFPLPSLSLYDGSSEWYLIGEPNGDGGILQLPGISGGAEILATREWVQNNGGGGGGGGGAPSLSDVLSTGNMADNSIVLNNSTISAMNLTAEAIQMQHTLGDNLELDREKLLISYVDTGSTVSLDAVNTSLVLTNSNGTYSIEPDFNASSGGTLGIPETSGLEVIATREWVGANSGSSAGPSVDRPVTVSDGMMYFDTTLGKPIWYSIDAPGWVDATGTGV